MLIEFTVGNFRSFNDHQTFSMVASKVKSLNSLDTENVRVVSDDLRLLKSAAIYGANGSGKSNLIRAMAFAREFILTSSKETQIAEAIEVERFRLAGSNSSPSFFEFVFLMGGKQYRYGFEVNSKEVVSEWLFYVPTIREAKLFERRRGKIKVSKIFKEGKGLEEKTRSNALFLSVSSQFNGTISTAILQWFLNFNLISGLKDLGIRNYTMKCIESAEKKEAILGLIKKLDLGIQDLLIEESPPATEESLPRTMPEELRTLILKSGLKKLSSLKTVRSKGATNSSDVEVFDLDEHESEGTQKLVSLAGPLIDTLESGKLLVIDEFDARLHPLVTREIIRLFNSNKTNPKGAQLIFATHDTNLLSNKLFRRDQIWFTERDNAGATHLYSLVEYKPRNDASYEKDYVLGRYGAIPFIGNLEELFVTHG